MVRSVQRSGSRVFPPVTLWRNGEFHDCRQGSGAHVGLAEGSYGLTGIITMLSRVAKMRLVQGSIVDDRYQIIAHVADGGMGNVYKTLEAESGRVVALKMLDLELSRDFEWRARFLREGKALSQLSHPHILSVYRLGLWHNVPFIAMEYLEGTSLHCEIMRNRLPWQRVAKIVMQICDGMAVAHQHRVIHRDLKPANIMLIEDAHTDFVKILDFGLARIASSSTTQSQSLTQTGSLIGSVNYMSPEQCLGLKADHRSDIYAVGCLLYESICGEPPFSADNPIGLMHKHVSEPVPSLSSRFGLGEVPLQLDSIIAKAMSKNLNDRYQSMEELKRDLSFIATGEFERVVMTAQNYRWQCRHVTAGALIIAMVSVLVTSFWFSNSDAGIASLFLLRNRSLNGDLLTVEALKFASELKHNKRAAAAIYLLDIMVERFSARLSDRLLASGLFAELGEFYIDEGDRKTGKRFVDASILASVDYFKTRHRTSSLSPQEMQFACRTVELLTRCGGCGLFDYPEFVKLHVEDYRSRFMSIENTKLDGVEKSLLYLAVSAAGEPNSPHSRQLQLSLKRAEFDQINRFKDHFFRAHYWQSRLRLCEKGSAEFETCTGNAEIEYKESGHSGGRADGSPSSSAEEGLSASKKSADAKQPAIISSEQHLSTK